MPIRNDARCVSSALFVVLACCALDGAAIAQNARIVVGPVPGLEVELTPSGDFNISYDAPGNQKKSFTYLTATKIDPVIRTEVTAATGSPGYAYDYKILNGRAAKQDLHSIALPVPLTTATETIGPPGWEVMRTPQTSRLRWYKIPTTAFLDGIAPGGELEGFRIVSPFLPAPVEVGCQGALPVNNPGLPSDLPPQAYKRLEQLLITRNYVMTWAIAPKIPDVVTDPNLSPAIFVARLRQDYSRALQASRLPAREQIIAALTEALEGLAANNTALARSAIGRVRSLAEPEAHDVWSDSLRRALVVCLDYLRARFGI